MARKLVFKLVLYTFLFFLIFYCNAWAGQGDSDKGSKDSNQVSNVEERDVEVQRQAKAEGTGASSGTDSTTDAVPPDSDTEFILNVTHKPYGRDLVTRFVTLYPRPRELAAAIGRSPSVISKLKKPEVYGELDPSARIVWSEAQSVFSSLSQSEMSKFAEDLRVLDLSDQNIFYDSLAERLQDGSISSARSASQIATYLRTLKDTFCEINLSDNEQLTDEGFKIILQELTNHKLVTKIGVQNVGLTDKTFECTPDNIELFKSIGSRPQDVIIDISGNNEVTISVVERFKNETGVNFIWE